MRHRGTTGDEIRDGAGQPAHPTTERLRPRAAPHHLKNLTHTHPLAGILPQTPRHHITQWRWQTVELRLLMHDPIRNPMRRPLTERPHSRHRERQHAPQCEHVRRRPDGVILGELLGRHEGRRADGHPRRGQRTGVTASSMEVLLSRYAKCLDGRQEIANREASPCPGGRASTSWSASRAHHMLGQATTGRLSAVSRAGLLSGEGEPQNDLAVVDLPGGLESELLVEGPRFAVAGIVAGQ